MIMISNCHGIADLFLEEVFEMVYDDKARNLAHFLYRTHLKIPLGSLTILGLVVPAILAASSHLPPWR